MTLLSRFFACLMLIALSAPLASAADGTPQVSKAIWASDSGGNPLLQTVGAYCCKRGGADWWTHSPAACRYHGGYIVNPRFCYYDRPAVPAYQVCCARGRQVWWSLSPHRCRWDGGYVVRRGYCR